MAQLIRRREEPLWKLSASWEKPSEVQEDLVAVEAEAAHSDVEVPKTLKMLTQLQNLLILQEFPIPFWE